MEPERVPKSFGCLPHRNLKLSLSRSRSKSASSSTSSPRTPKSPSVTPRKSTSSSTQSKEDEYREVFRRFDNDNDGRISAVELRAYFGSVGEYMSHEDAETVIRDADTDGDSLIDFQDFLRLMKKEGSEDEDLKAAFEMFEFQKGSGRITPKSLQKVLSRLGDAKSYDECVEMIEVHDTDGKGELHFQEFQQMMMA
ncbi:probable calcium-binding protein CML41 [Coffea arabica]|uniref:Probable calcium-binding protein CML41 n=1 Tax=Coffea arabica TaxID=13443 RepID=A0A6P6TJ87_COFAR|nr:probable calcium-binding protein CML41 [Coffea arabica]